MFHFWAILALGITAALFGRSWDQIPFLDTGYPETFAGLSLG
jgi:hypothetical protein